MAAAQGATHCEKESPRVVAAMHLETTSPLSAKTVPAEANVVEDTHLAAPAAALLYYLERESPQTRTAAMH